MKVIEADKVLLKVRTDYLHRLHHTPHTHTHTKKKKFQLMFCSVSKLFLQLFPICYVQSVANDPFYLKFPWLLPFCTCFLHLPLLATPMVCRVIFSHPILFCLPHRLLPIVGRLPPSLWLVGWFIVLSVGCRFTEGRAPLLWTDYVWACLLQRWARCY